MPTTNLRRRVVFVCAALSVLASACGTRVSEDEFATFDAAALASGGGPGPGGGGGAVPTGSPGGGNAAENKFGTLEIPCGKGDTSAYTASDKGITKDTIEITTISDPGGLKPGLDQGVFDSMEAFVKWCNAYGGINGRTIKLTLRDAKILEYDRVVQEACDSDFALVGGMGVLDNLGTQRQIDCGLINVPAVAVNPEQTGADLTFQSLPNMPFRYNVGPTDWVKQAYPEVISKGAAIYTNLPVTKMQSDRLVEAYEKRGFSFVSRSSANISEENWGPIVSDMKSKGVTYMTLSSSFEEVVPLAKAMATQDFTPFVELETNYYNAKFPGDPTLDGQAEGFVVRVHTWPIEEAGANPAMEQYLAIMKQYKPTGVLEFLGVQAFSSGLMWATAMKNLGANVTRAGLEAELQKLHAWDGGGLQAPSDPGGFSVSSCFVMMKVEGKKFVREYPLPDRDKAVYDNPIMKGMACPDDAFVELTGRDYRALGIKKPAA